MRAATMGAHAVTAHERKACVAFTGVYRRDGRAPVTRSICGNCVRARNGGMARDGRAKRPGCRRVEWGGYPDSLRQSDRATLPENGREQCGVHWKRWWCWPVVSRLWAAARHGVAARLSTTWGRKSTAENIAAVSKPPSTRRPTGGWGQCFNIPASLIFSTRYRPTMTCGNWPGTGGAARGRRRAFRMSRWTSKYRSTSWPSASAKMTTICMSSLATAREAGTGTLWTWKWAGCRATVSMRVFLRAPGRRSAAFCHRWIWREWAVTCGLILRFRCLFKAPCSSMVTTRPDAVTAPARIGRNLRPFGRYTPSTASRRSDL